MILNTLITTLHSFSQYIHYFTLQSYMYAWVYLKVGELNKKWHISNISFDVCPNLEKTISSFLTPHPPCSKREYSPNVRKCSFSKPLSFLRTAKAFSHSLYLLLFFCYLHCTSWLCLPFYLCTLKKKCPGWIKPGNRFLINFDL